jgi:hypothetical protein
MFLGLIGNVMALGAWQWREPPVWSRRLTDWEALRSSLQADCETGFDELKNQWGWGGYTHDLERCNLSACRGAYLQLVELVCSPGASEGKARSHHQSPSVPRRHRPTQHAGQCRLLLTLTHAASDRIKTMIANVRKGLRLISTTAPQSPKTERWIALVRYISSNSSTADPEIPAFSLCSIRMSWRIVGKLRNLG